MRRFIIMLPVGVAGLLALAGFFVVAPNSPTASVYPTAVQNYDAPTARSEGCVFGQTCVQAQFCAGSTDPTEGCEYETPSRCHGCIE
jgi:hypothetical protein